MTNNRAPAFRGIALRHWPGCVWMRLTHCPLRGHHYALGDSYYCGNCAYPWFFKLVLDPPRRPAFKVQD